MHQQNNYFIFTGGPGSGKSTVIEALKSLDYQVVEEVARDIIQQQHRIGGNATHTGDQIAFCQQMLAASIENYQQSLQTKSPIFFDRGIPDLVGYAMMTIGEIDPRIMEAVKKYRYNQHVFLFPPWQAIYTNDTERQQDFHEAIATHEYLKQAYIDCGYSIIDLAKTDIQSRTQFILDTITKNQSKR
jgi:predicted ATPase